MPPFELRQSSKKLTSRAGLALVGTALERFAGLTRSMDPKFPVRSGIATSDVLKSYVGLLCEGKSDFDAIESKRQDGFFARALTLSGAECGDAAPAPGRVGCGGGRSDR